MVVTRSEIVFGILRIPLDILTAALALWLAYYLRRENIDLVPGTQILLQSSTLPTALEYVWGFMLPWTIVAVGVNASMRLYALRLTLGPWREMGRVIVATVIWTALVMAWFFLQRQLFFSRILLAHAAILLALLSLTGRAFLLIVQRMALHAGIGVRSLLSCGAVGLPENTLALLARDPRYHYLGHASNAHEVARRHAERRIDLLLHTDAAPESEATERLTAYCRDHQIGYAFLPPVFADVPHQLSIGSIGLLPILRYEPTPLDGWGRVWKRSSDLVLGILLTLIISPLLLFIALLILLLDGWPVFYRSERVGQHGTHRIPVLKFRTMRRDADRLKSALQEQNIRDDGPLFKIKNDPRVTPCGKLLRRLSLDELPQLFNVLIGHLSLVGPRPHLPEEVQRYASHQRRVLTVRPGITGLAQISGRSGLRFEDEIRLDMRYIEEWSPALDLWILWRTFWVVLWGKEAD